MSSVTGAGLTGTAALLRLDLRRDRILAPAAVLSLVLVAASSAQATVALYPDPAGAVELARTVAASPALTGMYGPIADPGNPDAAAVFKTMVTGGVLVALLAQSLVRRHTRSEEETGRSELLGATVLGRRAPLTAAVLVATLAVVVTGLLTAGSLVAVGLGPSGSAAFGLAWIGIGLSFVGIAAVAAQLTETSRGSAGIVMGALGASYLLRVVGDTSTGALSALTWLSPIGWAEKLEVFGGDRFVVALLPLAFATLMVALAHALQARRDLGAGLITGREGPGRARPSLDSPAALARRLQRGALLGSASAFLLLGLVLGSVAATVGAMAMTAGVEQMLRDMGGDAASLGDVFLSTEVRFLAVAAAAYGISAALRLRSEESATHVEQILATGSGRRSVLLAHAGVALAGSGGLMLVLALGLAVGTAGQSGGLGPALGHILPAALSTVPAVWVCVGLTLALCGAAPRAAVAAAWALLGAFLVVSELGPLLRLPGIVVDLSPFSHGSIVPGGTAQVAPLLALLLITGALVAAATSAFRRRDIG